LSPGDQLSSGKPASRMIWATAISRSSFGPIDGREQHRLVVGVLDLDRVTARLRARHVIILA
jgi:hypothetical protein